eukprot:CAMPEP_0178930394 /NCGR_PEP_ID=MMETSP0786-20121207/21196_1 /TAXON_ID=186022 /ORGANISM="Thalassionema frauenfeldii, Strain CCMP 1798" /LENGTH=145 /DNA_ID=CAMNT_0020606887 /DNA_START=73 /DNA_END=510 /DNA_ORIENTATION=-
MRICTILSAFVSLILANGRAVAQKDSFLLEIADIVSDARDGASSLHENEHHYGPPDGGCKNDEQTFQIQGVPGKICTPRCALGQCPGDLPDGVTASPLCALSTPDGTKYCALICQPSGLLRSADDGCGDATCQPIQGVGICTYDG